MAAVRVLCHFLLWPRLTSQAALELLLRLLLNRYPAVRQYTAEQLYLQLLPLETEEASLLFPLLATGTEELSLEPILEILSESNWGVGVKELREKVSSLRSSLLSS
eukprot:TRINITY_DN1914_c0_g2_i2.p2 TRINITY_DN1914_c0_g2~~TRINITY_DN1914_c0_g2_i2.p2  ORF type:complete len:106 (+),score=19.01 TRINITY_DN1914_c0_g2_i2:139-456(+)